MVATPRSGAEISKKRKENKVKAIKKLRSDKKDNRNIAAINTAPLCYWARAGNITVGGLLWLFCLHAARQK